MNKAQNYSGARMLTKEMHSQSKMKVGRAGMGCGLGWTVLGYQVLRLG